MKSIFVVKGKLKDCLFRFRIEFKIGKNHKIQSKINRHCCQRSRDHILITTELKLNYIFIIISILIVTKINKCLIQFVVYPVDEYFVAHCIMIGQKVLGIRTKIRFRLVIFNFLF